MFDREFIRNEIAQREALQERISEVQAFRSRAIEEPPPIVFDAKFTERGDGKFKILSLDGSGIRTISSLKFLGKLEEITHPISETFDLIAGTSVGGAVALAATCSQAEQSAQSILDLLNSKAEGFFVKNPNYWSARTVSTYIPFFKDVPELSAGLFSSESRYKAHGIDQFASDFQRQGRIRDAKTNILIPTLDTTKKLPKLHKIKSWDSDSGTSYASEVARVTLATPIYFPRKRISCRFLYDGSPLCPHPALECYLEALANKIDSHSIHILSLGVEICTPDTNRDSHEDQSPLHWAKQFPPLSSQIDTSNIDSHLNALLDERYWRFTTKLEREIPLDGFEYIEELNASGDEFAEQHEENIRRIAMTLCPERN